MNKDLKDVIDWLGVKDKWLKDNDITFFVVGFLTRKKSGDWCQFKNGNGICEINKNDGTQITTVLTDEDFNPEFPLNCDMNISNRCNMGCAFCYQGCTKDGKHADIKKYLEDKNSFLYTLHRGTELAINGNEPLHPDLELLLKFCRRRGILANLTVNEHTLYEYEKQLHQWLKKKLIRGIGISPSVWNPHLLEFCAKHSTSVIHTIAGITTPKQYECLKDKNLKILILGYKTFGRGNDYIRQFESVLNNIHWLEENVKDFTNHFKVVSFDNLAIKQLQPNKWLTKGQWEKFYRGDDGHHTLFIDLVDETFAKNSVQPRTQHKAILSDIRDMLKVIKEESKENEF